MQRMKTVIVATPSPENDVVSHCSSRQTISRRTLTEQEEHQTEDGASDEAEGIGARPEAGDVVAIDDDDAA